YFMVRAYDLEAQAQKGQSFGKMDSPEAGVRLAEQAEHLRRSAQTALSVVWAVYAAAVLVAGFRLRSRPLRWAALGLFGLTLAKWEWFQEVQLPDKGKPGAYVAFTLPPSVFGKAQRDLNDLRLADAKGVRVPYALRVLRPELKLVVVPVRRSLAAGSGEKQG